jgi:two-component system, NarL family, sensor histidine kinase UhpB
MRPPASSSLSLLWRIFAINAAVFVTAAAVLALSPATIHASIRLSEAIVLGAGLVIMLIADLLLLRRTLAPLRRLAALMSTVDPMHPGRRSVSDERAGSEVAVLARSLDGMLDRLETERRESSRRALAAQEAERLRIARELHDEIGQTLTAVALRAERASDDHDPKASQATLAEMAQMIQGSLEDVRRISRELRPEALTELGLVNALIALCRRVAQQAELPIDHDLEPHLRGLTDEVELVIYRVAQEALTNVLRHSRASAVTVRLARDGGRIVLSVADNGRGLADAGLDGAGLAGMRERAMLIGADLKVDSRSPQGTCVRLEIPVAEPAP